MSPSRNSNKPSKSSARRQDGVVAGEHDADNGQISQEDDNSATGLRLVEEKPLPPYNMALKMHQLVFQRSGMFNDPSARMAVTRSKVVGSPLDQTFQFRAKCDCKGGGGAGGSSGGGRSGLHTTFSNNSKCLTLYCPCFAMGIYCSDEDCKCHGKSCWNNSAQEHVKHRIKAVRMYLQSHPQSAFRPSQAQIVTALAAANSANTNSSSISNNNPACPATAISKSRPTLLPTPDRSPGKPRSKKKGGTPTSATAAANVVNANSKDAVTTRPLPSPLPPSYYACPIRVNNLPLASLAFSRCKRSVANTSTTSTSPTTPTPAGNAAAKSSTAAATSTTAAADSARGKSEIPAKSLFPATSSASIRKPEIPPAETATTIATPLPSTSSIPAVLSAPSSTSPKLASPNLTTPAAVSTEAKADPPEHPNETNLQTQHRMTMQSIHDFFQSMMRHSRSAAIVANATSPGSHSITRSPSRQPGEDVVRRSSLSSRSSIGEILDSVRDDLRGLYRVVHAAEVDIMTQLRNNRPHGLSGRVLSSSGGGGSKLGDSHSPHNSRPDKDDNRASDNQDAATAAAVNGTMDLLCHESMPSLPPPATGNELLHDTTLRELTIVAAQDAALFQETARILRCKARELCQRRIRRENK